MSKYDVEVDLSNEGTSHAQIVDLVGYDKRVLDVGCASGYLAAVLRKRGCVLYGIEVDASAAAEAEAHFERVVVGDLETTDLRTAFEGVEFDVVVFGDVLEHLRDPLPPLRQARALLARAGSVVVSVPNVAHGAVRLSLLRGDFTYRELGLLDSTHLRFFTRDNLEDLMRRAGLVMVDTRRTVAGIFDTEIPLSRDDFPDSVVEQVLADGDATTYQFVVRAVVDDGDQAVVQMQERVRRLDERTHDLENQLADAQAALAQRDAQLAAAKEQAAAARRALEASEATVSARALRVPRSMYARLRRLR